jgi:hypothetical protein
VKRGPSTHVTPTGPYPPTPPLSHRCDAAGEVGHEQHPLALDGNGTDFSCQPRSSWHHASGLATQQNTPKRWYHVVRFFTDRHSEGKCTNHGVERHYETKVETVPTKVAWNDSPRSSRHEVITLTPTLAVMPAVPCSLIGSMPQLGAEPWDLRPSDTHSEISPALSKELFQLLSGRSNDSIDHSAREWS